MTTITTPAGTFTPVIVEDIAPVQESGNVVHRNLAGGTDITLRPAGLRSGRLRLLFATAATAHACRRAHAQVGVCSLVEPTAPDAAMSYVTDGRIRVEAEHETAWWVEVGFQEVTP